MCVYNLTVMTGCNIYALGRAYCLLLAVCWSVHQQFMFIFITEVAHTEMKSGIKSY